jgi:hypothetical protein
VTLDGRTDSPWYVGFQSFAVAVANAVARQLPDGDLPTDGIFVELLRHAMATVDDGLLRVPADPFENYQGVVEGYALASNGDIGPERWDVSAETLLEWTDFDRNFEQADFVEEYHRYVSMD